MYDQIESNQEIIGHEKTTSIRGTRGFFISCYNRAHVYF
jgi:hypothetical protein